MDTQIQTERTVADKFNATMERGKTNVYGKTNITPQDMDWLTYGVGGAAGVGAYAAHQYLSYKILKKVLEQPKISKIGLGASIDEDAAWKLYSGENFRTKTSYYKQGMFSKLFKKKASPENRYEGCGVRSLGSL